MHRRGISNEKSKDFVGSIKRLFKSLNTWTILIVISLILALVASIFSIITPNMLSNLTDTITSGIKPNEEKFKEIVNKIYISFPIEESNNDNKDNDLTNISDEAMLSMLNDFKINNTIITKEDQLETIKVLNKIDPNGKEQILKSIDKLPKSIYDLIKPNINLDRVKQIAIVLGILYILSSLFNYIEGISMTIVSNKFSKSLRSKISSKINRLPLKYFDTHETGDILSRMTNDVDSIGMNLNQTLSTLVSSSTLFFGSIIMMFITQWQMAITAIIASVIGFMFMGLILGKSQKYFNQRQKELGALNGYIEEMYSAHSVVKSYNGEEIAKEEFSVLNEKLYECNKKSQFLSGLMPPMMGFIGNLGYVAVCIVGALLAMNGSISFGVIVAFMIYVRLFTNPLSQIAQSFTSLQSILAASERVFEFLDEEEMKKENALKQLDRSKTRGDIEFKNVMFKYEGNIKPTINDFSAKASKGQKIAIVGPTGAGKTTMVNLLMKFYDINGGDILIDGVSIKDLTRENIHDLFTMVLQDTWVFDGTIRENIKFNNENVTDEEIWNSLKIVGVDHYVKTLPGTLDAKMGENDSISQGQKQLLTIARAMLSSSPLLILDEATSNVDTRTEELVQKAMDKLTKGKTSFIIAHRLSTIKNADLILVMKDGNIIETGSHEELIKKNGFYADLYNSQFVLE